PVPVSDTCCGLSGALSVMVTSPVRTSVIVGVKVTENTQLAPAAMVLPLTQGVKVLVALSVLSAKSPLAVMVEMFNAAVPLLVRVTLLAPLVTPMTNLPHLSEVGDSETTGPPPPPPAARAVMSALPLGLPHPVASS